MTFGDEVPYPTKEELRKLAIAKHYGNRITGRLEEVNLLVLTDPEIAFEFADALRQIRQEGQK